MMSALQLKREFAPLQRDLKRGGRALAELRQRLEHGELDLTRDERAQIEAKIASQSARLAELQRRYRTDLAAAQERRGKEMIARVEEVVKEIASEQGLILLRQKGGVLYGSDGAEVQPVDVERIDLTEPVIRALLEKINPRGIPSPDARIGSSQSGISKA